jgi:hypothetical protein
VQPVSDILSKQEQLSKLTDEHRALKERLRELDRHIALTSAERVERAQLKRLKLRTKEQILRLQQS